MFIKFILGVFMSALFNTAIAHDIKQLGIKASDFNIDEFQELKMPASEMDGKIRTLNKMGFMTPDVDIITKDFIDFSSKTNLPVLDGGAAYGVATIQALKQGATVVANDIDKSHLQILVRSHEISETERDNLYLAPGSLHKIKFPSSSLGAILLCRVVHFFSPEQVESILSRANDWLAPGGRLFLVTMTPYHYGVGGFEKIYKKRLVAGNAWPGVITSMTEKYLPENKGKIPKYLHVMDDKVLARSLHKSNFFIKKLEYFGHHRNKKDNGLGYIGVVAIKQS